MQTAMHPATTMISFLESVGTGHSVLPPSQSCTPLCDQSSQGTHASFTLPKSGFLILIILSGLALRRDGSEQVFASISPPSEPRASATGAHDLHDFLLCWGQGQLNPCYLGRLPLQVSCNRFGCRRLSRSIDAQSHLGNRFGCRRSGNSPQQRRARGRRRAMLRR